MYDYKVFGRDDGAIVLVIDTQRLVTAVQDFQYPFGVVPAELKWLAPKINLDSYEVISVINGLTDQTRKLIEDAIRKFQ